MQNAFDDKCLDAAAQVEFQIVVYRMRHGLEAVTAELRHSCTIYILLPSLLFAVWNFYWKNAPSVSVPHGGTLTLFQLDHWQTVKMNP